MCMFPGTHESVPFRKEAYPNEFSFFTGAYFRKYSFSQYLPIFSVNDVIIPPPLERLSGSVVRSKMSSTL